MPTSRIGLAMRLLTPWIAAASVASIALTTNVGGQDNPASELLRLGGSLRLRQELKDDFDFAESAQDYMLTQLRIHATWEPIPRVSLFVQAQDARIFGESLRAVPPIDQDAIPNIYADSFDLHQAYADLKLPLRWPTRLRLGRQKFNLGAKRLVASLEWVNTARVWDGARLTLGAPEERTVDLIASRLVPVDPGGFNDYGTTRNRLFNSSFFACYFTDWRSVIGARFEGYVLLRSEADVEDQVFTIGTRLQENHGNWDGDLEVAGQFGEFGGADQRALTAHAGAAYRFERMSKTRLGAAYNYGTGDGDAADDQHSTFDNQYPLNHAYYGYMDFFSLQNMHNLEATAETKRAGTKWRLAYQGFWIDEPEADAWYNAGGGGVRPTAGAIGDPGSFAGSEVDFTATRAFGRLALQMGYSHFFTGPFAEATGPSNDADFIYLMQTVKW
jgi:hypothetical protein